jgi:hypothetical protein
MSTTTAPETLKEITEDRFFDMLGALPPIDHKGTSFLLGEPYSHRHCSVTGECAPTYAGFLQIGDSYFETREAVTRKEFQGILSSLNA